MLFVNHAEMIITNLLVVKQHVNVALVTKLPVKITGHNVLYRFVTEAIFTTLVTMNVGHVLKDSINLRGW